jgi:cytochrome c-type biogenesis protein CcmH/NrfG
MRGMSDKSPFFVETKPLNRLDLLRERFDKLEALLGKLGKSNLGPSGAMEIPVLLDGTSDVLREILQEGQPPKEEITRLEDIDTQLHKKASLFVKAVGGPAVLASARQERHPGPERWWWFLDQVVAEERRLSNLRKARNFAIAAVILLVLWLVYRLFLAPSPEEQAKLSHQDNAQALVSQGNMEGALAETEKALTYAPADPELLVTKGVLQKALGRTTEADATFQQAESIIGNRKDFLLRRAQMYSSTGQMDASIADSQEVLKIDPSSPEAYMLLGQVYEIQEKFPEAIDAYEKSSKLADAQNRADMVALARMRMAVLMQRVPGVNP